MRHFKLEEFVCPTSGEAHMNVHFLKKLDDCRELAGVPFTINSGYRSEKHNTKIGGSSNSAHLRGRAADIRCTDSTTRWAIVEAAIQIGFTRIGIADTFVHLDDDPSLPDEVIWTY